MAKKVTIDTLDQAVKDILEEYRDQIDEGNAQTVRRIAQSGAAAVRDSARTMFKTSKKKPYKYAKGWTFTVERGRLNSTAVIYNRSTPGLPHLLENGHAKRGGGRVEGRAHIEPVEEKLVENYIKGVEALI